MSSKTQLNDYIKILRRSLSDLEERNGKLIKDLKWANDQVGGLTLKLKAYKERSWWNKLINKY